MAVMVRNPESRWRMLAWMGLGRPPWPSTEIRKRRWGCIGIISFPGWGRGQTGGRRSSSYWHLIFPVKYHMGSPDSSDRESGWGQGLWSWCKITIMELWAGSEQSHGKECQVIRRQGWVVFPRSSQLLRCKRPLSSQFHSELLISSQLPSALGLSFRMYQRLVLFQG